MLIPLLKKERESLRIVYSLVLQNLVDCLEKAFKAFFRRCKAGAKNPAFLDFVLSIATIASAFLKVIFL